MKVVLVTVLIAIFFLSGCHKKNQPEIKNSKVEKETISTGSDTVMLIEESVESADNSSGSSDTAIGINDSLHICLDTFELKGESVSFIYSYAHPRDNFNYTAFYKSGIPVITDNNWITDTLDGCDSYDIRTAWKTDFNTVTTDVSSLSPDYCIVVGTIDKILFTEPVLEKISESIKKKLVKILGLDTIDTTAYSIKIHNAGRNDIKNRYVIYIESLSDAYNASIIISEECSGQFKTLYELKNNSSKDSGYSTLTSQADLNDDKVADLFLVDFDDFGGKFLIIESNGKWRSRNSAPLGTMLKIKFLPYN